MRETWGDKSCSGRKEEREMKGLAASSLSFFRNFSLDLDLFFFCF